MDLKSKLIQEFVTIEEIKDSRKHAMAMGPFGSNITRDNFVENGIPVIRGVNLKNNQFFEEDFVFLTEEKADQLVASNAYPEDIVFTHRGTLGQVVIIPENSKFKRYVVSQSQMKLSCDKNKVNPAFVYYYFCSPQGQHEIYSYTNTTGVPSIGSPLSSLKIMKMPYLKLEEQNKIVKTLDDLDTQIHNIQNQNKTLEQMAQAIFKSWFVDFEGVTEFEDSELGKIPKGWSVEKISDICETFGGGTPSTKNPNYWDGQNYWLAPSDLTSLNRVFCVDSKRKITDEGLQTCASKLHPENSILMTSRATIGVFCINKIPVATNQGFIISNPHNPDYIYYIFLNYRNRVDEFLQNANGSTFLEISRSNFRQLPILIPTPEILDRFHVMAKLLFENIFINEKMIEDLTKTRDILLPKLMSGEIRV